MDGLPELNERWRQYLAERRKVEARDQQIERLTAQVARLEAIIEARELYIRTILTPRKKD